MRQVSRRSECWLLAELVGRQDLGDRQNFGPIGFEIGQRHRAIAGAEVDAETEASLHGRWCPGDFNPMTRPAGWLSNLAAVISTPPLRERWLVADRQRGGATPAASPYPSSSLGGQAPRRKAQVRRLCRPAGIRRRNTRREPAPSIPLALSVS